MKLYKRLKEFIVEKREFSTEQALNGWLKLGENEMFLNQLYSWQRINTEDIKMLLLLERDKKDIEKARALGRLEVIGNIIDKIEHAKDIKRKLYERSAGKGR